jgi:RimJ/RimL family protein N-acetyltransferase
VVADTGWLDQAPPEQVDAEPSGLVLTRARPPDADQLMAAINASLDHLRPWMPWAGRAATEESMGAFLAGAATAWEAHREFVYLMREPEGSEVLGCISLHARLGPGALEIGYWVHVDHTRRGLVTAAASALTSTAFSLGPVESVEIHCDAANRPSAAVPRRLGFALVRTDTRPPTAPGETDTQLVWVRHRAADPPDAHGSGRPPARDGVTDR